MALTIENATIGYDANEVQNALNNLNVKCISDTQALMRQGLEKLRTAVDDVWVGASAERFKNNMSTDVEAICTGLDETFKVLQAEFYEIVSKMDELDENLIKERGAK